MAVAASGAVWTNAYGVGDHLNHIVDRIHLALYPPSDRATLPTVEVTEPPLDTPAPTVRPRASGDTAQATDAEATATPGPPRKPVNVRLAVADPDTMFASQYQNNWCNPSAVQMVLAMHGLANTSEPFQAKIAARLPDWETRGDATAGGWGPAAMAEALASYGADGYEVRAYKTRAWALRNAAVALSETHAPVILIAWRGAHAWVMTGYRADADPTIFPDATITGTYIFDPWYPRISTIWGPSDPPGTFQDLSEMQRNYLPWQRPEGPYPNRDGLFLALVPTIPLVPHKNG